MKKGLITGLIVIAGLILVSAVYAHFPGGGFGKGYSHWVDADINVVKKFQNDTLPLRDELITKRLEIRQEYAKEKPDLDRIATLKKEIVDIRTRIQKKAEELGLPVHKGYRADRGMKSGRGFGRSACPGPAGW